MARILALALLFLSFPALGQETPDRSTPPVAEMALPPRAGLGFKIGSVELRPSLGVGYGYDSNVFRRGERDTQGPESSPFLEVTPRLQLLSPEGEGLSFLLDGRGRLEQYMPAEAPVDGESHIGGDLVARLAYRSPGVTVAVNDVFARYRWLPADDMVAPYFPAGDDDGGILRNDNRADATVTLGDETMAVQLGYGFGAEVFEGLSDDWGDLLYHELALRCRWTVARLSTLLLEATWQQRSYLSETQGKYGELTDNRPLRAKGGIDIHLVPGVDLRLLAGYGNSFHQERKVPEGEFLNPRENDGFEGLVADVSLSLSTGSVLQGRVGFQKDFQDSRFANFKSGHRQYLQALLRVADRAELDLQASVEHWEHSQLPRAAFETAKDPLWGDRLWGLLTGYEREDDVFAFRARVTVDIARFLAVEADYEYRALNASQNIGGVFGTCVDLPCGTADSLRDYFMYSQHRLLGSLLLRY